MSRLEYPPHHHPLAVDERRDRGYFKFTVGWAFIFSESVDYCGTHSVVSS